MKILTIILLITLTIGRVKLESNIGSPRDNDLQSKLDQKKSDWENKAPKAKIEIYNSGIQDVIKQGILKTALNVGDKATDFRLINALGKEVSLYEELKKGPVILTWYRGGWCP